MRPLTLLSATLYSFLSLIPLCISNPLTLKRANPSTLTGQNPLLPPHYPLTQDTDLFMGVLCLGGVFSTILGMGTQCSLFGGSHSPGAGRGRVSDLGKGNGGCRIYTGT